MSAPVPTRARARTAAGLLGSSLGALALSACANAYPQRVPGPLLHDIPEEDTNGEDTAEPDAPAAREPTDGATVAVQRNSDPVWLRLPGTRGERALAFHRKRERVPVGTLVRTGAGGRVELLWSPDASAAALFDDCRATLGDPARDEPLIRLHAVSRALLMLTPEDRVELVGGALLAGDPLESTGPIVLEHVVGSLLRVTNQSKRVATLVCRDLRLELGPGESLDLPLMAGGSAPSAEVPEPQRFEVVGFPVASHGRVERSDEGAGVRLTALEPARIQALGVEVRLPPEGTARFSGLSQVAGAPPVDPSAVP